METIRCGLKDVPHNTVKWHIKTNRHTSTRGNAWGWIEGAPGNLCWSNDSREFNSERAIDVVFEHNRWLEEQTPIALRLVVAHEKIEREQKEVDIRRENLKSAEMRLAVALDEMLELAAIKESQKEMAVSA